MNRIYFQFPRLGLSFRRSDIGPENDLYMLRWVFETPWGALRLHKILRADAGDAWHDHPAWLLSFILSGGYSEELPGVTIRCGRNTHRSPVYGEHAHLSAYRGQQLIAHDVQYHRAPTVHLIPRDRFHRISQVFEPTWTLVLMGARERTWGYLQRDGSYKDAHVPIE